MRAGGNPYPESFAAMAVRFSVTVRSARFADVFYTVRQFGNGVWRCDCTGYHWRLGCRHVDQQRTRSYRVSLENL